MLIKKWMKYREVISFIIMLTLSISQTHMPISSKGAHEYLIGQLPVEIL